VDDGPDVPGLREVVGQRLIHDDDVARVDLRVVRRIDLGLAADVTQVGVGSRLELVADGSGVIRDRA
jgi:hypothetical protein